MHPHLFIIDPGLMDASGHHAGLAEMAADSLVESAHFRAGVYCHRNLDKKLRSKLLEAGISVYPIFDVNFYELFENESNAADASLYITELCRQYVSIFQHLHDTYGEDPALLLYPCLNWEHACALALAIEQKAYLSPAHKHLACAMFNPGINPEGFTLSPSRRLNFHLGFGALSRLDAVEIYGSDFETKRSYERLLEGTSRIGLHPCYLIDWSGQDNARQQTRGRRIFLHLGDAKASKGFNDLPRFIDQNIRLLSEADRFVVHYTHEWPNAEIESTIELLQTMASAEQRLEIHSGFWDQARLQHELARASLFVFLYDTKIYQYKSSGIIWLTAWYGTPIAVSGESWLPREAARLGQTTLRINDMDLEPALSSLDSGVANDSATQSIDTEYCKLVYQPFWAWIETISRAGVSLHHA